MSRTIDACPPVPRTQSALQTSSYTIRAVTPIFGGGARSQENDLVSVLRGTTVRGHLRFWWRATRGAKFETTEEVKRHESEIWGLSDTPSKVQLWIEVIKRGDIKSYADITRESPKSKSLEYALFSLKQTSAIVNTEIRLNLEYPSALKNDVECAMWAWVNFGGIGARTRRGCGAIYCPELAPNGITNASQLQAWYQSQLNRFGVTLADTPRDWPTLPSQLVSRGKRGLGVSAAWAEIIGHYREFRQGTVGRKHSPRPRRSYWPEPDSIRRLTGDSDDRHKNFTTCQENAFPRAEFGLPIEFKFKDDDDPKKSKLYPHNGKRMSSPLILKPLATGSDSSMELALLLNVRPISKLDLYYPSNRLFCTIQSEDIRRVEATLYGTSPLKGRSKSGSALEGFISYLRNLKEGGFS